MDPNSLHRSAIKKYPGKILFLMGHLMGTKITTGGNVACLEKIKRWATATKIDTIIPEGVKNEPVPGNKILLKPLLFDKQNIYYRFVPLIGILYIQRTLQTLWLLFRKLNHHHYDLIYSGGDFICDVMPAWFMKIWLSPTTKWAANIFHVNERPFKRKSNDFILALGSWCLQRLSFWFIKNQADVILLLNDHIKQDLINRGFDPQKLHVIGAGISLSTINAVKIKHQNPYQACFLNRLDPTKGIFDLPSIWRQVIAVYPQAHLYIIGMGTGDSLKKLSHAISQDHRLEASVTITGFLPQQQVYKLLKSSTVFIQPSYEEGWGIVMFESLACQTAVVAYQLPAYQSIFQDHIITVPIGGRTAMAKAIITIFKDHSYRQKLAQKGYLYAQNFDWAQIARKESAILSQL